MTQLLGKFFKLLLVIYVFTFAYQWWRPLPDEFLKQSIVQTVPDKSVHFIYDIQKTSKSGIVSEANTITQAYQNLINQAEKIIIVGEEYIPEHGTTTLTTLLSQKHESDKHVAIALITDPATTRNGGIISQSIEDARKHGTLVITTELSTMPDANLLYSSFWRPFVSWWGNSPTKPWLTDPRNVADVKVPLRSWLAFYNGKSNESHTLIADTAKSKIQSIVASQNLSEGVGATGKVAVIVEDKLWSDIFQKQTAIASISNAGLPSFGNLVTKDESGELAVSLLSISHLEDKIIVLLRSLKRGDKIDIVAQFLSSRNIISELAAAANRGAAVRIIIDPNISYLGHQLYGMPNRPAAKELRSKSFDGITVRWCDARSLPCGARVIIGKTASSSFLLTGSADLSKRDLEGYNIESELFIEAVGNFTAYNNAVSYFDTLWTNNGGNYTVDYSEFSDNSSWRSSVYRMMERTGISLY